MKSLIKKLLRENLSKDSELLSDPLYLEGKKFYPNLVIKNTTTRNDTIEKPRFFKNPRKNLGSYSYNSFKNILVDYKINRIVRWLETKGLVTNFIPSKTTNSVYFTFNGKKLRISDHAKKSDSVDIIIKWDTQSSEIINQLNQIII